LSALEIDVSSRDRNSKRPNRRKNAGGNSRGKPAGGGKSSGSRGKAAGSSESGSSRGKPGRSGSSAGGSRGKASSGRSGGSSKDSAGRGRDRGERGSGNRQKSGGASPEAKKLPAAASGLPRHVVEALIRVTPPARQNAALIALAAAAEAFSEGQYHDAARKADNAKDLSSRDATIREILGLASYRIGDWHTALRELRTYRRLSGETTHMPVEMDVLRAMGRVEDVKAVWDDFVKRGGSPSVGKEARVVYASHLIDQGDLEGAAAVIGRPKVVDEPWPEDLRIWYVAARVAALQGDKRQAKRLADAIVLDDPSFPGLDELDRLVESI
jgi:predicted Zn-dependent protease